MNKQRRLLGTIRVTKEEPLVTSFIDRVLQMVVDNPGYSDCTIMQDLNGPPGDYLIHGLRDATKEELENETKQTNRPRA